MKPLNKPYYYLELRVVKQTREDYDMANKVETILSETITAPRLDLERVKQQFAKALELFAMLRSVRDWLNI